MTGGNDMLIALQLVMFCTLFFLLVKLAVRDSGLNCLYFYPPDYIDRAVELGLADKDETMSRGKLFMIPFCLVMLVALIIIEAHWNQVTDFKTAYLQACLFLVVMNWFDGLVIDGLWVSHSKIWVIPEMKGCPYAKPLSLILKRRSIGTIMYLLLAVIPAGVVVLIGKL
jgi:hypothetical protein